MLGYPLASAASSWSAVIACVCLLLAPRMLSLVTR
jgi:hypothetical protein